MELMCKCIFVLLVKFPVSFGFGEEISIENRADVKLLFDARKDVRACI